MRLCDNDAFRDEFMTQVYALLIDDTTTDRANQIIDLFDSIPAIESEEVIHAKWIPLSNESNCVVCSNCKKNKKSAYYTPSESYDNYCPNCGAKMNNSEQLEKEHNLKEKIEKQISEYSDYDSVQIFLGDDQKIKWICPKCGKWFNSGYDSADDNEYYISKKHCPYCKINLAHSYYLDQKESEYGKD